MKGQVGKILRVDLNQKSTSTIDTSEYEEWIGGHGLATALFFDLVEDKAISGFNPKNTLVIAPGLLAGTLAPATNRTEMVGIQAQSYPTEWFTRTNIGGRFGALLKYAGFDAITLEGAAEEPTWLNIIDGEVEFEDATGIWGLNTFESQEIIFDEVSGSKGYGGWIDTNNGRKTTQRPSVLAIGPAGENQSRIGVIMTDGGSAFGQGGFGGVWGSKNLKAISVLGTGSVEVADPEELMKTRLWAENYGWDDEDPYEEYKWLNYITSHFGGQPGPHWASYADQKRSHGCYSCHMGCRPKTASGGSNEAICTEASYYTGYDAEAHGEITEISGQVTNLVEKLGINSFEGPLGYVLYLHDEGVLGKGKEIEADIPFEEVGEYEFAEVLLNKIAYREGIGDDLAEGLPRAAEKWGRLEQDLATGDLPQMFWGYPQHYDARTETYWGYASIIGGRDVNCHDFNVPAYWMPTLDITAGRTPPISAEQTAAIIAEKTGWEDPDVFNFSTDKLYSTDMAKVTDWLFKYTRFWKQSCGMCDNAYADFINPYSPDEMKGLTPEGEMKMFKAVTGEDLTFSDTLEIGRKMWNLDRSILVLQGRTREDEDFPDYVYDVPAEGPYYMPVKEDGEWKYKDVCPRNLDREKVKEWKTKYYELAGWNKETGKPTRSTLEELGLEYVADELEDKGKI
ncbi:MAG: Aldehyde:ferredoxin oxidoreductase [Candidatus Methanohalarchaeum thermophilum]|uniref:Aldehyde:ferredoxin oxidoreductase n=1 Tax=Methanohalarchaeum thermophilum TaxID=1903181 RepID=A0A1Q6DSH6_METT1|nr:MAG: Aldehyde:ferredoxin oxidoreductase [Candidatus Methanohalarchaeum thermophilum]